MINVELKVCNIFVRHILLTKENQIAEQTRKHKYPAFFYEKRIIYFLLTFNVYFNMWPIYVPVMLSCPLLN